MKGLLRKDFYMAMKYCRMQIAVILIFAVCFMQSESLFLLFYPVVMAGTIPINLIAYDEKSRWDAYARVFPYSVKDQVSVKYLVMIISVVISMIIILAVQALGMEKTGSFSLQNFAVMMATLLTAGLLSPCIMLPAVFKLGVEKGRVIYYATFIGTFAILGAVGAWGGFTGVLTSMASIGMWLLLVILAADVVILGASWMLSIHFYQEREI